MGQQLWHYQDALVRQDVTDPTVLPFFVVLLFLVFRAFQKSQEKSAGATTIVSEGFPLDVATQDAETESQPWQGVEPHTGSRPGNMR